MTTARWQLLPPLTDDEFAALKRDVAENGVLVPIVVDAGTGDVIDGHHRLRAVEELHAEGVRVAYQRDVRRFADDDERVTFVVGSNLFRRHLTRHQRAEVVTRLRAEGWSLRRIGDVVGVDDKTVRNDLAAIADKSAIGLPDRVERRGGGSYPARRPKPPPSIVVGSARDENRARDALVSLDERATGLIGLPRAEERARLADLARRRLAVVQPVIEGPAYELRCGDFREVLADLADCSIDAVVTDPPYDNAGVPLYEPLGALCLRLLQPGRLAAVYAGHLQLDREMELLERGGLTYTWHGANVLNGLHNRIRARMVFGQHRSVLLYSAGQYRPRIWMNDVTFAEGRGGPAERPLHPWQQALEPVRHWVRQVSQPGELIVDPFLGSGTTAVAAVMEGRRFLGCDIDPGCVETTRRRLVELAPRHSATNGGDALQDGPA